MKKIKKRPPSKPEIAARRAESRRLGKACAELARDNIKLERERYWERATCAGKERTWGVPNPDAPLRRALRWSDSNFRTQGRHWVEPIGATRWRGHRAEFFGLKIDFRFYARRPIRFFVLLDDDDEVDPPPPRGYIVAMGLAHASVRGVDGMTIKDFFVEPDDRYTLVPPRRGRGGRYK